MREPRGGRGGTETQGCNTEAGAGRASLHSRYHIGEGNPLDLFLVVIVPSSFCEGQVVLHQLHPFSSAGSVGLCPSFQSAWVLAAPLVLS